jgi:serine/threonine protein kinase
MEDNPRRPASSMGPGDGAVPPIGPGTELAGRYQVDEAIGRGGMAMVFHGHDTLLERDVAIKVLGSAAASAIGSRQEFLREARAAAALSHPNIVGVYDAGVHGAERYIVMEYVAGGSLFESIQQEAPLPPGQAVRLTAELADALDYGHRRGLVHCDVKPQNVLLDDAGRPKLVDFGISRSIAATGALTDTVTGTAGYIAPEQLLGERLDGRADIYSLGCLVYEMLSGELPFEASNLAALATQRLVRPPIPLRERNPDLSPSLSAAVMRALEREREQRYGTATEFARALRAASTGLEEQPTTRLHRAAPLPPRTPTTVVEPAPRPRSYQEPPSRRLFWPLTLLLLLLLVGLGALAAIELPPLVGGSGGTLVAVPAVTQQSVDAAAQALQSQGLKVSVTPKMTTECPQQRNGLVLGQSPTPPAQLRTGQAVTLVVSFNDGC